MATINAIAHLNLLTKDSKNDYYLTPQVKETLYVADIVKRLRDREIATKNVDGAAFIQTFLDECAIASAEGNNIATSFFRSSIGIQGVVLDQELGHNIPAQKLKVSVNLTQGDGAKKAVENAVVYAFEQAGPTGPVPQVVMEPQAGEPDKLTVGCMVLIKGMRLAVKGSGENIGVRFRNVKEQYMISVPPSKLYPNTPSTLQFVLPAEVEEGEWELSITTQANSNGTTLMKEPRTGNYPKTILVVAKEPDRPEEV